MATYDADAIQAAIDRDPAIGKPEECKHGKWIVHCAPCFKNAKK